jgi:PKD repeat protein
MSNKLNIITIAEICILFFLYSLPAAAVNINILPATTELPQVGNTFQIDIHIEEVSNLGAFEIEMDYDPAIIFIDDADDIEIGPFLGSTGRPVTLLGPVIDNVAGILTAGGFTFGNSAGPDGIGVLLQVTFTVSAEACTEIDFNNVTLADIFAVTIYINSLSGGSCSPGPVSDAGADQAVDTDDFVTLNGNGFEGRNCKIQSYQWNQKIGTTVSLSSPEAEQSTFTAPHVGVGGDRLIFELIVTDNDGLQDTDDCIVNVTEVEGVVVPLVADAGPDQTVDEGDTVTLNGSDSSDPDGTIVSYLWTQTDGPAVTIDNPNLAQPTFTAPPVDADGDELIFQLTVTDDDGLTDPTPYTKTITVNALPSNPPIADAGGPYSGVEGQPITFDGSGSTDSDGNINFRSWDFGDNSANRTGISFTHTYSRQRTYTVTLTVWDNEGNIDKASATAIVSDAGPTADFSGSPTSGNAPLTVVFTDSSDVYDGISSWAWDFGDGGTSDIRNPDHTFSTAGAYTVSLTVTDGDGSSDTLTRSSYITVLGDTDSDGDGISDNEEGAGDLDNDGAPDCLDADTARISAAAGGGEISLDIDEASNKGARFNGVEVMGDGDPGLSQKGKPDVDFKYGLVKFTIHGLAAGGSLKLTITYPAAVPTNAEYCKYDPENGWYQIAFGSNDGDNAITITLT